MAIKPIALISQMCSITYLLRCIDRKISICKLKLATKYIPCCLKFLEFYYGYYKSEACCSNGRSTTCKQAYSIQDTGCTLQIIYSSDSYQPFNLCKMFIWVVITGTIITLVFIIYRNSLIFVVDIHWLSWNVNGSVMRVLLYKHNSSAILYCNYEDL